MAGKPAAAARTKDAKHRSSATQYSNLSTAPSPGPSPRDMGVHAPAGVYAAMGEWAHRWPSAPPPPRSGRRGEKHETPARQRSWRSGRGRGRRGGGDRGLLTSPAIPPPPPRSSRAIAERTDCKSLFLAQQEAIQVDPQRHRCNDFVNTGWNLHHFPKLFFGIR